MLAVKFAGNFIVNLLGVWADVGGGGQARANLARSLYIDADIYLRDDPLSAVCSRWPTFV